MFSKPITMVLAAIVGLAGLHVVAAAPSATCPSGKASYCCGNPDVPNFTLSCRPFKDTASCSESGGIQATCEHTDDGGMECTLPQ